MVVLKEMLKEEGIRVGRGREFDGLGSDGTG